MNRFQDKFAQRAMDSRNRLQFSLIEDQLNKLEEKTFPQKRTPASLNQQMLLLEELGLLDLLKKTWLN